ncbi:CGNR zinc finger domain-containing protein [Streptomyces sp. NPDC002537]
MDAPQHASPTSSPGEDLFSSLALVNTELNLPSGPYDGLTDPAAADAWLARKGLVSRGTHTDAHQTARLRGLRTALRDLFQARVAGAHPEPGSLDRINDALAASPGTRALGWSADGPYPLTRSGPGDPVDAALTRLAEDGADLLTGAEAKKIAICGAPGCTRLFLRSHAARRWCSDRCGNRVRATRHYTGRKASAES